MTSKVHLWNNQESLQFLPRVVSFSECSLNRAHFKMQRMHFVKVARHATPSRVLNVTVVLTRCFKSETRHSLRSWHKKTEKTWLGIFLYKAKYTFTSMVSTWTWLHSYTFLFSPQDGVVLQKYINPFELVLFWLCEIWRVEIRGICWKSFHRLKLKWDFE